MSSEINIILENISEITDSSFTYSDRSKGAGYNLTTDPFHTVIYHIESFVGTIVIQATLSLDPTTNDWFDVESTESSLIVSTSSTINHTFKGNYTWIRAAYNLQSGAIRNIKVSI